MISKKEQGKLTQDHIVTRYIFEKSYFDKESKEIYFTAFSYGGDDHRISVYRITDLLKHDDQSIWGIGREWNPKRTLHARGDLKVKSIENIKYFTQSLFVEGNNIGPYRHCCINPILLPHNNEPWRLSLVERTLEEIAKIAELREAHD